MKNIYYSFLLVLSAFSFVACESFLADDINLDPNKPGAVPVNAVLPNIQIRIADVYGGDTSRFNSLISQHVEGVARQWTSFNNYTGLTPNRFNTAWSNYYENILIEVNSMIAQAEENGYNHYSGVGKVLKAFSLMVMTDMWGDIPYTQAALGIEQINPAIDSQASIYTEIYTLLSSADGLLAGSNGGLAIGGDDVIYGGDIDKWRKSINAIRARGLLHQGDHNGALAAAKASFTSRDDNMSYTYNSSQPAGWWRFNDGRTGDIEFHPFLRDLMQDKNDTIRLANLDQTFITSHPYFISAFRQDLISYREIQFIIAETSTDANEKHTAYLNAIKASFDEVGISVDDYNDYVAQTIIDPGAGNLDKEDHILTQKYIGLFVQPEVFNDLRRNDFPAISPTSGSQIPVRWNYPSDELLFNSSAPADGATTLFTPKVGWDN